MDDDSAIRAIPVDSDDGYVETVVISAGKTLNAIQYFDGGGDLVKEEIYDRGIVRMELIYQNSKLRKIVPLDVNGNSIEGQIVILPVITIGPYR